MDSTDHESINIALGRGSWKDLALAVIVTFYKGNLDLTST